MFDSIKTTRAKNIEHTTSLIANNDNFKDQLQEKGLAIAALKNELRKLTANNDNFKDQLQEKGLAIAALKNELRKLTGNSVNTKFAKSSILGKPVLQPHINQSVVRQLTVFKSERPRSSSEDGNPAGANIKQALGRSYALSWKPCQGDSLNLPDHSHIRPHALLLTVLFQDSYKDGDGDASFQLKSDSLPHAHAQTTKTYYKHQDSRIMKAQELKTKTSAQTLIYKIFLQRYQVYQGRLLASFQDDAKYEHVGQDTRSQGGKDDQDGRIKI
ncbi:hypothetical protein Tco_0907956 [Tanacetum coccineum]|uniref:Uncharacterized protein n=1 Tax=Tanacetum coccineum TaxID=301880 RepID=A0ABQ5CKS8_9ASTR